MNKIKLLPALARALLAGMIIRLLILQLLLLGLLIRLATWACRVVHAGLRSALAAALVTVTATSLGATADRGGSRLGPRPAHKSAEKCPPPDRSLRPAAPI